MNELKEFWESLSNAIYSSTVMGFTVDTCEGTLEGDFNVVMTCVIGQDNVSGTTAIKRVGNVTTFVLKEDGATEATIEQDVSSYFVPGPVADEDDGLDDLITAIIDDALFDTHGYMGD